MIDRNLERLLSDTARDVTYPATPDLSDRVVASLQRPAHRRSVTMRPAFGLALLVAVVAIVAALAITPSRDALARLFGVEGSEIIVAPTPAAGVTPTPRPTAQPLEALLNPVSIEDLQGYLDFEVAIPSVDEEIRQAYYVDYGAQRVAVLSYGDFDVWEADLMQGASFGKVSDTLPQDVEVGSQPGAWLSGGPHSVWYAEASGMVIQASGRTVERNTLVWRTDSLFYRIETDLGLEDAIRIAETLP